MTSAKRPITKSEERWRIVGAAEPLMAERDRRLRGLPPQTLDEIEQQIRDLVQQLQQNFYDEEVGGDDSAR